MLPQSVRIKFEKKNALKFISHLDVCRTMKAALLRASIPVWYTEGFNPHPKMVFSLPLSIGTESECEFMDIKITAPMPYEEIKERLCAALTPDMGVLEVYAPQMKFSDIGWASYQITAKKPLDLSPLLADEVFITKQTKKGEVTLDVKNRIKNLTQKDNLIEMLLSADSENFLNPDHLMKLVGQDDYRTVRKNVFSKDMTAFR